MESHKIHVPNHQPVYVHYTVAKPKQLSSSRGCYPGAQTVLCGSQMEDWPSDPALADVKLKVGISYGYKYIYNYDICI